MTASDAVELFNALLCRYEIVAVVVDASKLVLPKHLVSDEPSPVVFHFGLNLPKPITDLTVDETGISGTLSFDGVPLKTMVPWDAIEQLGVIGEPAASPAPPASKKSRLRAVGSDEQPDPNAPVPAPPAVSRPALRLVK